MRAQLMDHILECLSESEFEIARAREMDFTLDDDTAGTRRHHEDTVGEEDGLA